MWALSRALRNQDRHRPVRAARGADAMGMSYELAQAHVEDMKASVWTLEKVTFTGAAILLRDKAAYRSTSFRIAASGQRRCRANRAGK